MRKAAFDLQLHITINGRRIGRGEPVYIIAEMSANHGQNLTKAREIIHAMKKSGADAVKLQTYTPDTLTIDCRNSWFVNCLQGTIWEGRSLYELYCEAFTPWKWQPELKELAESLGMDCFSTAFDESSVDFLEKLDVPAYKVASFELVHLPLIRHIAKTGKPMILSTGMATEEEIAEAVNTAREAGALGIALLKCTSAYPAKIDDANLRTIPALAQTFGVPVGLSDHTLGSTVPVLSITQGACIIEKHFVLDRERDKGPDSAFSMEPHEFRDMVDAVRCAEQHPAQVPPNEAVLGSLHYGTTSSERGNLAFRPSIYIVKDIMEGEEFTLGNLRIIRPGYGLPPKLWGEVLVRKAACNISRGTPLQWEMVK